MDKENTREQENKQKRELLVRSFFSGVELEGNPITNIRFEAILSIPHYYAAWLSTQQGDEAALRFPPAWIPLLLTRPHDYLGWVFVYQEDNEVCASLVGPEQRVQEVLRRKPNMTEMALWLELCGYQQIVWTSTTSDVYGLYMPTGER